MVLKHRQSLQKSLCPVVIRPYLCSSDVLDGLQALDALLAHRRALGHGDGELGDEGSVPAEGVGVLPLHLPRELPPRDVVRLEGVSADAPLEVGHHRLQRAHAPLQVRPTLLQPAGADEALRDVDREVIPVVRSGVVGLLAGRIPRVGAHLPMARRRDRDGC